MSLMSTRYSGFARRSFIIGSRLWPPAITRPPGPTQSRDAIAPRTLVARSYSNGPGVCTCTPFRGRGHLLAGPADLLGGVVLDRRIAADHRRAGHQLRSGLADLRVQGPSRGAAV